jgi:DNA-binding NarL/FixJ family response regulator
MIGDKEASPKIDFLVATDEAGYSEVETTMDLVERLGNLPDEELAELFRHYWLNMPDKRHSTRATLRAKALRHARREGYIQPTELQLSPREVTVLTLYAQGMTHPQIAEELGLSPLTIKSHFRRVNQRLQAKNTTHSVVIALTSGWITVP